MLSKDKATIDVQQEHQDKQVQQTIAEAPKVSKFQKNKEVIAELVRIYPACFSLDTKLIKPLKIGIFDDLVHSQGEEGNFSKTQLRAALRQYTSSWNYLGTMIPDSVRIDLEGAESGQVTAEEAEHAKQELESARAKVKQRKESRTTSIKKTANKRSTLEPKKEKDRPRRQRAFIKKATSQSASKKSQQVVLKEKVSVDALIAGQKVAFHFAGKPVQGVVERVEKNDVFVQLDRGISIKVSAQELHQA